MADKLGPALGEAVAARAAGLVSLGPAGSFPKDRAWANVLWVGVRDQDGFLARAGGDGRRGRREGGRPAGPAEGIQAAPDPGPVPQRGQGRAAGGQARRVPWPPVAGRGDPAVPEPPAAAVARAALRGPGPLAAGRPPGSAGARAARPRSRCRRSAPATSAGSTAGNMPMRSWLRPSLRYGSVSTIPLARSDLGDARPRRRTSSKSIVPTTAERCAGSVTNGVAYRRLLRPVVQARRTSPRCAPSAHARPPLAVASSRSGRPAGTASPPPGCCRSAACARVVDGGRQVEKNAGDAPAGGGDRARPAPARPGTSARSTARRRSRSTSAARSSRRRTRPTSTGSPPAPLVASTSTQRVRRRPRAPGGSAWPRRSRSRCGSARRRRRPASARGSGCAARAARAITVGSSRNGAAFAAVGELARRTRRTTRCCDRGRIRPNAAMSQNAVVPPLPSTTS